MRTFRLTSPCLTLALLFVAPAFAQDADQKTIEAIVQEIEMVPSLYGRNEKPTKLTVKFSAAKLAPYAAGVEKQTLELERERWKVSYAQAYPLRAALFEAAQEAESFKALKIQMVFVSPPGPMVAVKQKAYVMQLQEALGKTIFKLEQALKRMLEAEEKRAGEKSLRWKADFDFGHARLQTNLLFLQEYSYALGQIRADAMPALAKDKEDGWRIVARAKITVPETKAKQMSKDRLSLLKKIQEDHPGTPWAYFAELESRRDLGMEWAAKKK
jgi:hypothetical protein